MAPGEVAEWSNAPHSKCGIGASLSGVRIPPSPPLNSTKRLVFIDKAARYSVRSPDWSPNNALSLPTRFKRARQLVLSLKLSEFVIGQGSSQYACFDIAIAWRRSG